MNGAVFQSSLKFVNAYSILSDMSPIIITLEPVGTSNTEVALEKAEVKHRRFDTPYVKDQSQMVLR